MMYLNFEFIVIAALATVFAGISKGGFGSGAAFASAAILATIIEPGTAIGIMLPLLILMDLGSLKPYWKKWRSRLQSGDSLGAGHVRLRHHELDILRLNPSLINITFLDFFQSRHRRARGRSLGLEGVLELRRLPRPLFRLDLTHPDARVRTRRVENIRRVDHEHRLLALPERHALHVVELFQAQLLHRLARLLFGFANIVPIRCFRVNIALAHRQCLILSSHARSHRQQIGRAHV